MFNNSVFTVCGKITTLIEYLRYQGNANNSKIRGNSYVRQCRHIKVINLYNVCGSIFNLVIKKWYLFKKYTEKFEIIYCNGNSRKITMLCT